MRSIVWFRRDLRVHDNCSLSFLEDEEVFPIFIFDTDLLSLFPKNDYRLHFIYTRVLHLKKELQKLKLDLKIFIGKPKEIFQEIFQKESFTQIYCSGDNDSYSKKRDEEIGEKFPLKVVFDNFLIRPQDVLKKDGTPYRVFTPFFNRIKDQIRVLSEVEYPYKKKGKLYQTSYEIPPLDKLVLEAKRSSLEELSREPESIMESFSHRLSQYKEERDLLSLHATSRIGIHLRFGTISIREVIGYCIHLNGDDYIRQLMWREFYNYLLFHFPKSEFENFQDVNPPYGNTQEKFKRWCSGTTGVPLVDAGMRELNTTGYIHNRARMIVASFLTKNLFIHWKWGEEYFKERLIDYEGCSNIGSWQWAASTGADAVPYFRVFNPYLQSKKFDRKALYIKKWVKELQEVEAEKIHNEEFLMNSTIANYPKPMVNHGQSSKFYKLQFKGIKEN